MSRLITTGFELQNDFSPFSYGISNPNLFAWVTDVVRSGTYSLRIATGTGLSTAFAAVSGSPTEVWVRCAVRFGGFGNFYFLQLGSEVRDDLLNVVWAGGNGAFGVQIVNTRYITTPSIYVPNTWYLVEVHFVLSSSGLIELRVDGIDVGSWSGNTKPGSSDLSVTKAGICVRGTFTTVWFDDFALNDASGSIHNTWCGEGGVILMRPNAAGDSTQWTPNTGSNWSAVDDTTPDGDTTYVASETAGDIDLYHLENPSLPSGSTISLVQPVVNARKDTTDPDKIQVGIKSGNTVSWSADRDLMMSYTGIVGDVYGVNPDTGLAWTEADLNNLQVGIKAT